MHVEYTNSLQLVYKWLPADWNYQYLPEQDSGKKRNMESRQEDTWCQSASQMEDVIDDEFEITLESPRDKVLADNENDSILKLIQNGDQVEVHSEKINIPTIVVTDINDGSGDQGEIMDDLDVDNKEMKDDFTEVVDKTFGEIVLAEANSDRTEEQMQFSNILSDSGVTVEVIENNPSDMKNDVVTDTQRTSGQLNAEQKTVGSHMRQALDNKESELEFGPAMKEERSNKEQKDDATQQNQLETNTDVDEGSISLESIVVREKTGEDSDPDEFDFDLPTPKTKSSSDKHVLFKDTETESDKNLSAMKSDESTDSKPMTVTVTTKQEQPTIISGNRPVAVIKPTTQVAAAGSQSKFKVERPPSPVSVEENRSQQVLESAQAEWDRVTTITAGFSGRDTVKGPEPVVVQTTPAMSPHEMVEYLKTADFSHVKASIKTNVERRGLSAFVHMLFGPPKLNRSLHQERDMIFCTAASPLSNENLYHIRTLQTIYRCLTGSKFDCARTGSHWEEIGFQGNDPGTDLRGAGLLGLVNLLYLLKDPKKQSIANDIYRLSLHPTQNFPFCVMGINMSRITLQSLREEILNRECNRRGEILSVVNDFYVGLYLQMYQIWKSQGKTIQDSGYVIKDLEVNAKRNPRAVLKNLEDYLNKKKTVVVADKSPDLGGDNFLSLCDDPT